MNKEMEQIISKDLGVDIDQIRKSSWRKLDKIPRKIGEKPFRPQDMFIVSGNINLAEKREMGNLMVEIRSFYRKVMYQTKCLLRHRKNV